MNRELLSKQIIHTCLEMTRLGLNQGTAGNVSVRYQSGMLITPTGIPYEQLTTEKIVYVDGEGKYEEGKLPSSEWGFHLAIYKERDDVNAVVHNHATHCAAVSIFDECIPAIHYMVAVGGNNHIPCVPYATFGTKKLAENVAQGIKKSKAILLSHHGCIAAEDNLEKALWLAHEVEILATWYMQLLATGKKFQLLSDGEMDIVLAKFKNYGLRIEE
ncbi:L-fuculose-phosphate aldolase [Vibrio salinus]|uniref:L-fuculose-phosphate aldolase n=1 Tax=Vibrio salinus TaxID=2899784 RepID=UPI001E5CFCC8|nr:L-fuculose-phosphate aldolase [Vibrio salinus]MCE0492414.1 L-fuculose-phosphate aldolase [Vibrio salinus]